MEIVGGTLLVLCLALVGSVLFGELIEKISDFLKRATATLAAIVVVVVLIIQLTPLEFGRFEHRIGKIVQQVKSAALNR